MSFLSYSIINLKIDNRKLKIENTIIFFTDILSSTFNQVKYRYLNKNIL